MDFAMTDGEWAERERERWGEKKNYAGKHYWWDNYWLKKANGGDIDPIPLEIEKQSIKLLF